MPRRPPPMPTPEAVRRAALAYLERHTAPKAHLARLLEDKARRWAVHHRCSPGPALEAIVPLLDRLEAIGVLDDPAWARARARRLRRRGASRRRILAHLVEHGVARPLAEEVLAGLDPQDGEDPELEAALRTLRRRPLPPRDPAGRRRALARLARAGFTAETAHRALERAIRDATGAAPGGS